MVLAVFMLIELNVNTFGTARDGKCLSYTSVSDIDYIGIACKLGDTLPPLCCCAFFALKTARKTIKEAIDPPSCRYARILNC